MPPDEDDEDPTTMKLLMRKYRDGPSRKIANMHWDLNFMDIHETDAAKTNGRFAPRSKLGDTRKQRIANPWAAKVGR
jgi:hypothetical protein